MANESWLNNCDTAFALGCIFLALHSLCTLCFKPHKLSIKFNLKIASTGDSVRLAKECRKLSLLQLVRFNFTLHYLKQTKPPGQRHAFTTSCSFGPVLPEMTTDQEAEKYGGE